MAESREVRADRLRPLVREAEEERGPRQVAREIGMSPAWVQKYIGGAVPYPATLNKIEQWASEAGAGSDAWAENRNGGPGSVRERGPEWPEATGGVERVDRILQFFGSPTEGFRRMARNLSLRDFAKAAVRTAIDDEWPEAEFQALYREVKDLIHESDEG